MTDDNNSNNSDDDTPKKTVAEPMSFTISGTQGGKARLEIQTNEGPIEGEFVLDELEDEEISLDRMDVNHEEEMLGINVLLRINEDGPTPEGIDGGRITRMTLTEGSIGKEKILAHFDNGEWRRKPEGTLATQVMMRAKKQENGLEMPTVLPAFDHTKKHIPKP